MSTFACSCSNQKAIWTIICRLIKKLSRKIKSCASSKSSSVWWQKVVSAQALWLWSATLFSRAATQTTSYRKKSRAIGVGSLSTGKERLSRSIARKFPGVLPASNSARLPTTSTKKTDSFCSLLRLWSTASKVTSCSTLATTNSQSHLATPMTSSLTMATS